MVYLVCALPIKSPLGLEQLGAVISAKLLNGVPFVGREEYIRDEVPAIYARAPVLGLRVILQGFGGAAGYQLVMHPSYRGPVDSVPASELAKTDISAYVALLLAGVDGLLPQLVNH